MSIDAVFRLPLRVYFEDTDAAGVVYYANYLRYMERARTEWLRSLGFGSERLAREAGIAFVVRSTSVEFERPARLDDAIVATVAVRACSGAAIVFAQRILRAADGREECLVRAEVKVACVNIAAFRAARIPSEIRAAATQAIAARADAMQARDSASGIGAATGFASARRDS